MSNTRPYIVALLGVTLIFWARTLTYQFVWDDVFFVVQNDVVSSPRQWTHVFTELEAQSHQAERFNVFRPLRTLHYIALSVLGGGTPKPALFHAANVLWHALAVVMLFGAALALLRRWPSDRLAGHEAQVAFCTAIVFAVHPLNTEVVCWVKGLDDLMATTLSLACVWVGLARTPGPRTEVALYALLAAALYSKVSALPLVLVPALVYGCVHHIRGRGLVRVAAVSAFIGLGFLAHRHAIIGQSHQIAPLSGTYAQTLLDTLATLPVYASRALGIPPFRIDYSYLPAGRTLFDPLVAGGLLLIASAAAWTVYALRTGRGRLTAAGLIWAGLFFAPVSNIVPMMQYMAERFAYLPMAGLVFTAVIALALTLSHDRFKIVFGVLFVLLSLCCWVRMPVWQNDVTLFVSASQQTPQVERVVGNAVKAVLRQPHMDILTNPASTARQHATTQDWAAVMDTLQDLDRLYPDHHTVQSTLGMAHALQGQPGHAATHFERAYSIAPTLHQYRDNALRAHADAGHWQDVIALATPELEKATPSPSALQSLAAAHWSLAHWEDAKSIWQRLNRLDDTDDPWQTWIDQADAKIAEKAD